jgi:phage N-6-adenine-methyltransferase
MAKATQTKELTHLDILNESLERADSLIGKLKFQEMAITPADPGQIASWQQELAYAFSDIWKSIKIVPELRKLIPPLLPAEREGLRKSIEAEGIRDHLSLWQAPGGQLVLVDGHNRFEIAMETHEIFTFRLKDFSSVSEAQNWMIDNQLSRRNLSDEQRRYLIGKRYQAEKGSHGGPRIPVTESPTASVQTEHLKSIASPSPKTVERVAKELKVSPSTVKRADKFAAGADRIGEHSPQLQGQILSGEVKLPKGQVEALADQPDQVIAAAVATLESVYPENPEYARDVVEAMITPAETSETQKPEPEPEKLERVPQFTSIKDILVYADKHRRKVKAQKLTSSESDEWTTPQDLWDALNARFQFSLDVAATATNAKCSRFFTLEDDGLAQSWAPVDESDTGACWMNHPYSQTEKWLAKAFETAMNGERTMVCLPKVDTSTNWWWDYCRYGQVLFLPGRYKFNDGEHAATFASAVVIFPKNMATNPKYRPTTEYWDWTGKRNEKLPLQAGTVVKECGGVIIDDVVFMRKADYNQHPPDGKLLYTWQRCLTVPSLFKGKGRLG